MWSGRRGVDRVVDDGRSGGGRMVVVDVAGCMNAHIPQRGEGQGDSDLVMQPARVGWEGDAVVVEVEVASWRWKQEKLNRHTGDWSHYKSHIFELAITFLILSQKLCF